MFVNIPPGSKALGNAGGQFFRATVYVTPTDARIAEVFILNGVTDAQLAQDMWITKLKDVDKRLDAMVLRHVEVLP